MYLLDAETKKILLLLINGKLFINIKQIQMYNL